MFDKFDAAFIDSLNLLQNVPDTTGVETLEVGLLPMKSGEPLTGQMSTTGE